VKFLQFVKRRINSESGDSQIVTLVLILPFFFSFLITIIDTSIYFSDNGTIQQVARDGARQVAIFGGAGDTTQETPIEASYSSSSDSCSDPRSINSNVPGGLVTSSYDYADGQPEPAAVGNALECYLLSQLVPDASYENASGGEALVNVQIQAVQCGPFEVQEIGSQTYCEIWWTYNGVPGSVLSFINQPTSNSAGPECIAGPENGASAVSSPSLLQCNNTRITSESEVDMAGVTMTARP
jgi:hypothetical protein